MERLGLGPNGALKYCIDTLCNNEDWLINKLRENKDKYIIIDCPGQLELYKSEGDLWKVSFSSLFAFFYEEALDNKKS